MEINYGVYESRFIIVRWYAKFNGRKMFYGRCIGRNRAMRKALKHARLLNEFHKVA